MNRCDNHKFWKTTKVNKFIRCVMLGYFDTKVVLEETRENERKQLRGEKTNKRKIREDYLGKN